MKKYVIIGLWMVCCTCPQISMACLVPATEYTQLLNHALFLESIAKMYAQIRNQIKGILYLKSQYQTMRENLLHLDPDLLYADTIDTPQKRLRWLNTLVVNMDAIQHNNGDLSNLLLRQLNDMQTQHLSPGEYYALAEKVAQNNNENYHHQLNEGKTLLEETKKRSEVISRLLNHTPHLRGMLQGLQLFARLQQLTWQETSELKTVLTAYYYDTMSKKSEKQKIAALYDHLMNDTISYEQQRKARDDRLWHNIVATPAWRKE